MNSPLIKWTGSKRSISNDIIKYFPKKIKIYYEPFVGGGSVFFNLLKNKLYNVDSYIISDINKSLIDFYNLVQQNPFKIIQSYYEHWKIFNKDMNYYYVQREIYNKTKDPLIFYFLTRTCYNGTIRYNSKNEFNTSVHIHRKGMTPDKVEKNIIFYNNLMRNKDIQFICDSYLNIFPKNKQDIIYLDPPYTNSKALYFGNIDIDNLFNWIRNLKCSWFLNLNAVNEKDSEIELPFEYDKKLLLKSGKSSYSRLKNKTVIVKDYFYYSKKQ